MFYWLSPHHVCKESEGSPTAAAAAVVVVVVDGKSFGVSALKH